jgi:hypothetical protein
VLVTFFFALFVKEPQAHRPDTPAPSRKEASGWPGLPRRAPA